MFKNFTKNIYIIAVLVIIASVFIPSTISAETRITANDVKDEWIWEKSGSPYILLESIYIPDNYKLTIKEGVEIISDSNIDEDGPHTLSIDGELRVLGTVNEPVIFKNLDSIFLITSESNIKNSIFEATGLVFEKSTTTIDSIRIEKATEAVSAKGSRLNISNSTIAHNTNGISSFYSGQIYQVNQGGFGMGGIGNATLDINSNDIRTVDTLQNIIKINNSNIYDNKNYGILNQTDNTINAKHNWWGNKNGPNTDGEKDKSQYGDTVMGYVDVEPWRLNGPDVLKCCSNILFIPGIQASRLYKDTGSLLGTTTNMLWEPNRNNDIELLKMDTKGISFDKSIYVKDIISSAYSVKPIYRDMIKFLDNMVIENTINSWKSLPYDWRNNVVDIVDENLINNIYAIASTSKTGKVSIISHSNGGLLTKSIMKALEKKNRSEIIDNIIFIAVPELGTTQAILGMLHGYEQSILKGVFLSDSMSRKFSQNVPGAYGLLPSKAFFDGNQKTMITDSYSSESKKNISNYESMKNFLLKNSFSKNSSEDINIPLNLNSYLLRISESLHNSIDNWKPASTTKVSSIFGWGNKTVEGIQYQIDPHCTLKNNKCPLEFIPNYTDDGDGTVLTYSNSNNSDTSLYFNLKKLRDEKKIKVTHSDILESVDLTSKIKELITNTKSDDNTYDRYFSNTKPVDDTKYLNMIVHSPVYIDAYDTEGNHTGHISSPDQNGIDKFESQIPDSFYGEFGRVKLLIVPYNEEKYKIVLNGYDTGAFSIDANISQSGITIASTTFSDMPATSFTSVELIIATSTESFASSTKMNIDIDGDGNTDFINHTDTYLNASSSKIVADLPTYIASIKKIIFNLNLPQSEVTKTLNRINRLEEKMKKNGYKALNIIIRMNMRIKNDEIDEKEQKDILLKINKMIEDLERENK